MYSRQEAALRTQQFWTAFGGYMAPVLSADGEKINWVNYKTGQKGIRFAMITEKNFARIGIYISHKDVSIQQWYYDRFVQFRQALEIELGETWDWRPQRVDEAGRSTSEISATLEGASVLNPDDWPAIISFFKPRLVALDAFWCGYKFAFEHSA